jgi:phosphate transport system protein
MGAVVEDAIARSVHALATRDRSLAEEVRANDDRVDQMEIEIEEECLRLLALQQPVAIDLRFIISVFKINNDLERIGDVAASIARRAKALAGQPALVSLVDFAPMAELAQRMLRMALDALVNGDRDMALRVLDDADAMKQAREEMQARVEEEMKKRPEAVNGLVQVLAIVRHLDRIGDLATNISEDVIYMLDGVIIRHRVEDYRKQYEGRKQNVDEICATPQEKKS